MKKKDNTEYRRAWLAIGATADEHVLGVAPVIPQEPMPPKEKSAKKPRKGKAKK